MCQNKNHPLFCLDHKTNSTGHNTEQKGASLCYESYDLEPLVSRPRGHSALKIIEESLGLWGCEERFEDVLEKKSHALAPEPTYQREPASDLRADV